MAMLCAVAARCAVVLMWHGARGMQRTLCCMHVRVVPWSNEAVGVLAGRHWSEGDVVVRVLGIRTGPPVHGLVESLGGRGV